MADVSARGSRTVRGSETDVDRAQLFLVAAIVLAVLFVALAALLNTVIYTGTIAARDTGADTGTAIEYHGTAETTGHRLLTTVNDNDGTADVGNLTDAYRDGIDAFANGTIHRAARHGTVLTVTNRTVTGGSRIRSDDGQFTTTDGTANWTLAADVRVRNYTIEATPTTTIEPGNVDPVNVTDTFFVTVDGGATHALHLYADADAADRACVVARDVDAGTLGDPVCVDDGTVVLDVTNGTIAPASDPADTNAVDVSFFGDVGPGHAIEYTNGDGIEGSYTLFVDDPPGSLSHDPSNAYASPESGDDPTDEAAVYGAAYDVRYRSERLRYESSIRVAPREAPYDAS
ncbi:hypothetical protein [Halopenitus sp. POP-27]|uniref:DUF7261 family protein n=1 Tax=Halopenitus sp. POP-27 TaxID=2994425 RepID=UPI002468B8E2|nr:hypothetical protein [Halopenitus sp. POP-27]